MHESRINEIAQDIQKCAENIHCASAIFAVEKMLTEDLQKIISTEIQALSVKMEAAIKNGQWDMAEKLLYEKDVLVEKNKKTNIKIHIIYEALSPDGARLTISDEGFTIILPNQLQKIICDGTASWTDDMKVAKNDLREKTIHELGHIMFDAMIKEKYDEDNIDTFAEVLLKLRNNRPEWMKGSAC